MPSHRSKVKVNVPSSCVRDLLSAKKVTKNIDSDDTPCEIVFEGTPKSTSSSTSPQKPSDVKQTLKSKELCDDKPTSSRAIRTSVISSTDKMGKENVGLPSPQVTLDSNGCIVLDESSLVVERRPAKPETEVIYENTVKRKNLQWTEEDTKKFYASLGTVQTDFTLMSRLFSNVCSRDELKLKFKREERRNRDLIDKALSSTYDVSALLNDKFNSGISVNKNSSTRNDKSTSMGNKSTANDNVSMEKPFFKSRARQIKRIRKFYFASDSDEDVKVISEKTGSQTNCKKMRKQTSSSQPPLPSPDKVLPKSATCALDNDVIPLTGFNIRRPTVMRIGENGERQAFDARVVLNNTENEVLPEECSSGSWKTRLRQKKSSISYKEVDSTLYYSSSQNVRCDSSDTYQNVWERWVTKHQSKKKWVRKHGGLDVVKLLLGHLKDADLACSVGNEATVLPESESNVLKTQRNNNESKGGMSSEIHGKEPEVEVVFENVSSPSKEYSAVTNVHNTENLLCENPVLVPVYLFPDKR